MRKHLLVTIFSFVCVVIYSQQDAQYTQYMYNTISVNPAYAGSRGVLSFTGLHRSQWVGLEGAPRTQTLSIHSPLGRQVGLGFSIVNDDIGPTNETYFDVSFSYTISTSDEGKLSFGIKGGGHLLDVDFAKLNQYVDQLTTSNNINDKFSPNIGAGVYYHTDKFYAGLSVPNFLETDHFDESSDSNEASTFIAKERINYYFITGYVFDLTENWKFKPAGLVKMVVGAPLQVDVSANFMYNERLRIGAAYRWSAAWSAMAGFQVTDGIMVGLAYDRETTDLGNTTFNDGSFEVILRFELFNGQNRIISSRFF